MVEVSGWVTTEFNGTRTVTHTVISQELHGTMEDLSGGLVLMKQVPSEKNKVNLGREIYKLGTLHGFNLGTIL